MLNICFLSDHSDYWILLVKIVIIKIEIIYLELLRIDFIKTIPRLLSFSIFTPFSKVIISSFSLFAPWFQFLLFFILFFFFRWILRKPSSPRTPDTIALSTPFLLLNIAVLMLSFMNSISKISCNQTEISPNENWNCQFIFYSWLNCSSLFLIKFRCWYLTAKEIL